MRTDHEVDRDNGHNVRPLEGNFDSACAEFRTAANFHETADTYAGVMCHLCPRHRVIACKDGLQWILQRRDGQRAGRPRWTGVGYFRTRNALIAVSRALCKRMDPNGMAMLVALPGMIGGDQ
ncbi:hypothetical protein HKCCE3408_14970 [Rhodobacterales bacterium HKCCE3408]|nr:hypothetical protein [Rhodobacterales bacterium HKCCE3408]